ncbi:uncharacterized protein [Argopecten irradians]|uniref:uncharacterized protein n=1 Tax=Argopecten irradians TaxID=31199 RepID=UPI0037160BCA
MADSRKSRSGFFSLCLNTACNPNTKHLNYRIAVADKLLGDFRSLEMSKTAILNLKGIFMFYSRDQLKAAIGCFREVLETNANNKNAIAHLITVYQRLHINSKARYYMETQERFEEELRRRGRLRQELEYSITDDSKGDTFLFEYYEAEALAEQGIAFFMDCYTEEDEWVRADRSLKLFVNSLNMIVTIKSFQIEQSTLEKVDMLELEVKYWLGQCFQKVHQGGNRRDTNIQQPCFKDSYREGIQCLVDIIKSELDIDNLKSWAWAYLGVFFFKKPKSPDNYKQLLKDLGLTEEFEDPRKCFEMAFELETVEHQSTETRIRYATYLRSGRPDPAKLEEAIDLLNYAWSLCEKDGNWFAMTMLSQVNTKMFKTLKQSAKDGDPEVVAKYMSPEDYLNAAIDCGEEALKMNTTAMDLANVAEAYYLRGLKSDGTMEADSADAMNAAEYFWQAVQCLGTEKKPEVHRKHGIFLKAIGEDRQAIECFKRGMEVDIPNTYPANFDQMFDTFLKMYSKQTREDEPDREVEDDEQMQMERGLAESEHSVGGECQTSSSTGQTDQAVDSENGSSGRPLDEQGTRPDPAVGNKPLQSTSSSGQGIMDLELDGSMSSKLATGRSDHALNTKNDITEPQETSGHEQNKVLYEMAYWYQYATRHYKTDSLRKCTRKYIKNFKEGMSMMHAYLELESDKGNSSSMALSIIEDAIKISECEIQSVYQQKVTGAKDLLERKTNKKKEMTGNQTLCHHCSQPLSTFSNLTRQNSLIPDEVPQPRNTYYKYDFYMVFSRAEKDWVYYSLLQKLEKSYQFKGAIPERDYRLGHNVYAEMERCIKESLKVLIILSNHINARDEMNSKYEIDFALTLHHDTARGHHIIPVLKDDNCFPPRQLSTLTCVNAVQSNAWEKIVRALESK